MGKKSRRKKERRILGISLPKKDLDFMKIISSIKEVFCDYSPSDLCLAINVSELWLKNISSQAKHSLLWHIILSMQENDFLEKTPLITYQEFEVFFERVFKIIPSMSMLEDYTPELDWGEIRYELKDRQFFIFYGGAIERISDFIGAYYISHGGNSSAVADMDFAIKLQHEIISKIPKNVFGNIAEFENGHVELPTEEFWNLCRSTLLETVDLNKNSYVSKNLILELGKSTETKTFGEFTDILMSSKLVPGFLLNINGTVYPLAPRNAASTVIQLWSNSEYNFSAKGISEFIDARFRKVISGPISLISPIGISPIIFSSIVLSGNKVFFIFSIKESDISKLKIFEEDLKKIIEGNNWALIRNDSKRISQIAGVDGPIKKIDQIVLLAITEKTSVGFSSSKIPKTQIKVFFLPEFVSIFDSLEDINDLEKYWAFEKSNPIFGLSDHVDKFSAFKESHSVISEGTYNPNFISLDPHWGSNWRYRKLSSYWANSPFVFPRVLKTAWLVKPKKDGVSTLISRNQPIFSESITVNDCTMHFLAVMDIKENDLNANRVFELFVQCLADSTYQQKNIISDSEIFKYSSVSTYLNINKYTLNDENDAHWDIPLLDNWKSFSSEGDVHLNLSAKANIWKTQKALNNTKNSAFEKEVLLSWVEGIHHTLSFKTPYNTLENIKKLDLRLPRFKLDLVERRVCVPDYANPLLPTAAHYKTARKKLAFIFKSLGINEGEYELDNAKAIIDRARDKYKSEIQNFIFSLEREKIVKICIEQIDMLIQKNNNKIRKMKMSLTQDVDFNVGQVLADHQNEFKNIVRNYRYILECRLSYEVTGTREIDTESLLKLLAEVDWYLVLCNASDVLHNSIDVAGLKLDDSFVPTIHYQEFNQESESAFSQSHAEISLGIGLNPDHEVNAALLGDPEWVELNSAFEKDVGFSFTKMLEGFVVLQTWAWTVNSDDFKFIYTASRQVVVNAILEFGSKITAQEAEKIVDFITINPERIRLLEGKGTLESDVPNWEHNKRTNRYMIKPLIPFSNDTIGWGAGTIERVAGIWIGSCTNGYMPADFNWPIVKTAVRKIKEKIEKSLEKATVPIFQQFTPYVLGGIDFKRKFPKEGFEDVGDFDLLAYWPEKNIWVTGECKYNQPAFCLKDGRRLKDRIFEKTNKGQFFHIEKRREFLKNNHENLRKILNWPIQGEKEITVYELYISRNTYWWMHNTPYSVPTQFVQIDMLDTWLRKMGFIAN